MNATEKHVELWYDDDSDPDQPVWCVSLCRNDGEEISCLDTHVDREDAEASALAEGKARGLSVYELSALGERSELAAAEPE